jgi:hypothetical protein
VRSRVVLNIMDGLRGVWHAGPFSVWTNSASIPSSSCSDGPGGHGSQTHRIDRAEARSRRRRFHLQPFHDPRRKDNSNPNTNHFIREPGMSNTRRSSGWASSTPPDQTKVIEL